MRISNRSVLSLAFLLVTGILVAIGMTGCEPQNSGRGEPPSAPSIGLSEPAPAPAEPAPTGEVVPAPSEEPAPAAADEASAE